MKLKEIAEIAQGIGAHHVRFIENGRVIAHGSIEHEDNLPERINLAVEGSETPLNYRRTELDWELWCDIREMDHPLPGVRLECKVGDEWIPFPAND